jgi:hypothetical protein
MSTNIEELPVTSFSVFMNVCWPLEYEDSKCVGFFAEQFFCPSVNTSKSHVFTQFLSQNGGGGLAAAHRSSTASSVLIKFHLHFKNGITVYMAIHYSYCI